LNTKLIIGIIIAIVIIGGGIFYMNFSTSDINIEDNSEVRPEGKQFVIELSDAVELKGT